MTTLFTTFISKCDRWFAQIVTSLLMCTLALDQFLIVLKIWSIFAQVFRLFLIKWPRIIKFNIWVITTAIICCLKNFVNFP